MSWNAIKLRCSAGWPLLSYLLAYCTSQQLCRVGGVTSNHAEVHSNTPPPRFIVPSGWNWLLNRTQALEQRKGISLVLDMLNAKGLTKGLLSVTQVSQLTRCQSQSLCLHLSGIREKKSGEVSARRECSYHMSEKWGNKQGMLIVGKAGE